MDSTRDEPDRPSDSKTEPEASLQPLLGDVLGRTLRRLLERGRVELGRAAQSGRGRLELRQLQRDLDHFWVRLGKTSYHLVNAGELDHPALRKAMARIDELEQRIDALRTAEGVEPDPES